MAIYVPLAGSKRALLPNSRPAGPVDGRETISLTVRVRSVGDPAALAALAYSLAALPVTERTYLTHEELARQHGASQQDLDTIEHFAHRHDLVVSHRSAAERSLTLRGRMRDMLAAFHADVQIYHHASGTYRGRLGEIQLPEELSGIVTGIFGFDTRPKIRAPHAQKRAAQNGARGPGGQDGEPATAFAERYHFPVRHGHTSLDGAGQTVAIIELGGGFRSRDLRVYFHEIGSSVPRVSAVMVDHAGNTPSTPDTDDGEVMLDLEVAGAVVPQARFAVYFAPNNGDKGFLDAISTAVHDAERKPGVISISWGGPEISTDPQGLRAYHELFAAAGALGITVCAASGDHGTADQDAAHWDGAVHVDHPACDDLVLGCGGTQILAGRETAWNDGTAFDINIPGGGGWASGGGISEVFGIPTYQAEANLPVSIKTQRAGRGVPDIAMSATNYFTRVDTAEGASGGTSAVAPLMAALVARLNQAKGKNVGFLNPFLYANAATGVVHDVVGGSNAIKGTVSGYQAGPGWNACTGLGTPNGEAILEMLG